MKKIFSILFVAAVACAFISPTRSAEAQEVKPSTPEVIPTVLQDKPVQDQYVTLTKSCCDGNGNVRCFLINWTPVGNDCYCYGQGWGFAC